MFKCEVCFRITKPYEKQTLVVGEKRAKTYENKGIVTHGWEIVYEVKCCPNCVEKEIKLNKQLGI